MTRISQHMVSMGRGEVTPYAHARIDLEDYLLGLATCQNFIPLKYGGVTRVPGTLDVNACADSTKTSRVITFVYNQSQAYAMEFADQVIRFHTEDGTVSDGGSPYEVVSPYLEADLWNIQTESIGDVIYITCPGYQQRTLTRITDTNWALAVFTPDRGPFLDIVSDGASLKPSGTGHAIPKMTSNTAPSGVASDSDGTTTAWETFDRDANTNTLPTSNGRGWVAYDFGAGTSKTITGYVLRAPDDADKADSMPISWAIEGKNDGSSDWVIIDVQKDTSDWIPGEVRFFELLNDTAFRHYRLHWHNNGGTNAGTWVPRPGSFEPLLKASEQTPFNLTATSTVGINEGAGFKTTDVGRQIKVLAEDGYYRFLEIKSRVSTVQVTAVVLGPAPIPDEQQNFGAWALQAWSDETGYPSSVTRHKGRLGFFRSTTALRSGWLSVSADYDNFSVSQPLLDDDAINFALANGDQDEVLWATSNDEDLLLGTVGGVRVISPRDDTLVFSPTNHEESGSTRIRAGSVLPVWIGKILLFANKQRQRVHETAFSRDEGGYVVHELGLLSEHLFRAKVKELHYQPEPLDTLWAVMDDGSLLACTYDRQNRTFGVGRVVLPGTSASVESMAILPGDDYDIPMLVTKRTVNGAVQYRIEKMLDVYRHAHASSYDIPVYMMAAARYSGAPAETVTGLDYLEGETVRVYGITDSDDYVDLGDFTVSAGQISIPSPGVSDALIGLTYTSKIETLRPPNLSKDGHFMNRPMRVVKIHADVFETHGLRGGGSEHTAAFLTDDDYVAAIGSPNIDILHTGMLEVPSEEGWATDQTALLTTNSIWPATIRALAVELDRGT